MALREEVILSIQRAQQQISQLESELSRASQPINVPVTVQGEEAITRLQTQLDAADETVDVRVQTFGLESADRTFAELSGSIDETRDRLQEAQAQADRLGDELATTGSRGATAFGNLRSAIGPLIATFAAGLGLRELVGQFNAAVDSAIALNESLNAVQVVFGEGTQAIQDFGETSAQSVGLATSQVNQLVVPIGALLQNFGLEGREAADAALELTQRAADLASVFNTDVDEALTAIGSALRGEQEPIRRFGVNLDAASADARALELGLVGVGEEVDIAARGQANYSLLLEQTAFAAGDFANTADEVANRQRVLTAEFEEVRAEIGQQLLPVFESLLEKAPELAQVLSDSGPAIADLAEAFVNLAIGASSVVGPFAEFLDELVRASQIGEVEVFESFVDELSNTEQTIAAVDQAIGASEFFDVITGGLVGGDSAAVQLNKFTAALDDIDDALESGVRPATALEEALDALAGNVPITAEALEALQSAAGATDEETASLVRNLLDSREALGLNAITVDALTAALIRLENREIPSFDGALVGFENLDGARNLAATTEAIEGADRALFNLASGSDDAAEALRGTSEAFPIIVRNIDDLQVAAEDAGVSVTDFLDDIPDNVVLDLSQPQIAIATLIEELDTLDQRLADFQPENVIDLSDFINEDTGQIDASLADIRQAVNEQLGAEAEFQLDLSQIALVAPDIAAILEAEGIDVAADIAAKFADDLENAADQQAFIDGNKGLALATAEQYAEFLKDLTPEELQRVAAFGPQNLIPALRDQLVSTGQEMAEILDTTLGETTIAPELTIDLANIIFQNLPELTFDVSATGTTSTGTGTGSGGNPPPPPPVEVIINNPTTEDLNTSATQAGQTIQAVSSLLPRAQ